MRSGGCRGWEGEVDGGVGGDLRGGEGKVVIEGARECPEGERGTREEWRWELKEDGRGWSW